MKNYISFIIYIFVFINSLNLFSQNMLSGRVIGADNNSRSGLPGATLRWLGTTTGTVADQNGEFSIEKVQVNNLLIVSFVRAFQLYE